MYGSGLGMVLELNLSKEASLLQDRLQHQSASQEKHGNMGDSTFSSISLLVILGPGDRRPYMRFPLRVHYQPFSVTSEGSLIESEPRYRSTNLRDRRLHEV